jgi:hypothetical protein
MKIANYLIPLYTTIVLFQIALFHGAPVWISLPCPIIVAAWVVTNVRNEYKDR